MSAKKTLPRIDRNGHKNQKEKATCEYHFVFGNGDFRGLVNKEKK